MEPYLMTGNPNLILPTRPPAWKPNDQELRALLLMMNELERSLERGRKALLALDLSGIERESAEQNDLVCRLRTWLRMSISPARDHELPEIVTSKISFGPSLLNRPQFDRSPIEEGIQSSRSRILEAVRVQRALLKRAEWRVRVLTNSLAGTAKLYGPFYRPQWRGVGPQLACSGGTDSWQR